jgi:hypothetical protein|tara:strand:- start:126 stop:470 length:345 start_codon:yes stop_codon:yes gene_type:complete
VKNIQYRLFILILFLSFNSFSTNNVKFEIEDYQIIEISQDWYATTGFTRNTDGTNYSLSVRVQGYSESGVSCLSVSKIKVRSGGSWQIASYYSVIGESCTYYVNVDGNSYYFTI